MAPCPPACAYGAKTFFHIKVQIFLAVSERHRLLTCIEKGLRGGGGARIGAPPEYATGVSYITSILRRFMSAKTKKSSGRRLVACCVANKRNFYI